MFLLLLFVVIDVHYDRVQSFKRKPVDAAQRSLHTVVGRISDATSNFESQLKSATSQPEQQQQQRRHIVVEITDTGAVEADSPLLAQELGVIAWWRPGIGDEAEVGARGDVICETAGNSEVVGEKCVAIRLHDSGRVVLVRWSGLRQLEDLSVQSSSVLEGAPPPSPHTTGEGEDSALDRATSLGRTGSQLMLEESRAWRQQAAELTASRQQPQHRSDHRIGVQSWNKLVPVDSDETVAAEPGDEVTR